MGCHLHARKSVMATTTDLPSGLLRRSDPVAYLVRSFQTNARIRSLTTGTFNRVVKDRIAFRLSGAPSVLDGLATRANPAVLETLQTYVAAQTLSTLASHRISTRFPQWNSETASIRGANKHPGSEMVHVGTAAIGCPVERSSTGIPWKSGPSGPRQPSMKIRGS